MKSKFFFDNIVKPTCTSTAVVVTATAIGLGLNAAVATAVERVEGYATEKLKNEVNREDPLPYNYSI